MKAEGLEGIVVEEVAIVYGDDLGRAGDGEMNAGLAVGDDANAWQMRQTVVVVHNQDLIAELPNGVQHALDDCAATHVEQGFLDPAERTGQSDAWLPPRRPPSSAVRVSWPG